MRRVASEQLEFEVTRLESPPPPSPSLRSNTKRRPHGSGSDHTTGDPARGLERLEGKRELSRLALTFAESAAMLGVSDEFFAQHVARELRFVRRGRKKLVAVREPERWLEQSAARELL